MASSLRAWLRPWVVVGLVALAYLGGVLARAGGDPMAFVQIGTQYSLRNSQGTQGYDGQFSYYIARDPLHAAPYLDVPAYRYQRILYPAIAWALTLGHSDALPWMLPAISLMALLVGTALTERLLVCYGASRWYALVYGLFAGQLMSVRLDLAEPLAQMLVQAAILSEQGRRRWLSAALFAMAGLAKETTLVYAAGFVAFWLIEAGTRRAESEKEVPANDEESACRGRLPRRTVGLTPLALLLVVFGPFVAWQLILKAWLGRFGVGSGGAMATGFEIIPFGGLWQVGSYSLVLLAIYLVYMGPMIIIPAVWALRTTIAEVVARKWHPASLGLLATALSMLFLPFSTYRESLAAIRVATGLVAAVLVYAGARRQHKILRYSLAWLAMLALLVKE